VNLRGTPYTFDNIIGVSDAIEDLRNEASRAAASDLTVLILRT
jgi:transcriptional regulator with PAS, ATPase and Fis domain